MWFKQATVFQFSNTINLKPEEFHAQLQPLAFSPCLPTLPSSLGWIPPVGPEGASLVHAANGYWMLCLQFEEKILPATVIRQAVLEKVKEIEEKEDRVVRAKEKQSLKDEMTQTLLPKAFTKKSIVYGFIDVEKQRLIIDSNTPAKVERFTSFLKRAITPNTLKPIEVKKPTAVMTHWLKNDGPPRDFEIGQAAVLQDPQQYRRVIRCQHQNLMATGIQSLLEEGCEITQLALDWKEQLQFTLTSDFSLRSIRFQDAVIALSKDDYSETPEQRFDTDFVIMTEVISNLLNALLAEFVTADTESEALAA